MATRFKSSDLQEMIRKIVRHEMKENLATLMSEVFAERYLKQIAETAVSARPRGVNNLSIMGDEPEDEETPEVLSNSILGVGQENPVFKKTPKDDAVRQHEGVNRNAILSMFFEGTKPLKQSEEQAEEGIPIPENAPEVSRWKELVEQADKAAEMKKPMRPTKDLADEEARIKRMREQLDAKVVG